MLNLESVLIPEDQITPFHAEAKSRVTSFESSVNLDLDNIVFGLPYLNYLVITHLSARLQAKWQDESVILYNRYYWFLRFVQGYKTIHGKDAGLDQQAFQILEHLGSEIDWQVVESIDEMVNNAKE